MTATGSFLLVVSIAISDLLTDHPGIVEMSGPKKSRPARASPLFFDFTGNVVGRQAAPQAYTGFGPGRADIPGMGGAGKPAPEARRKTMAKDDTNDCETGEADKADEAAEAAYYVETLKANRRIAEEGDPLRPGQTHRVERDEKGNEVVRRKRFSAI
jgi:hypothetical protein